MPAGGADRLVQQAHLRLTRGAAAFLEIARRAGGGDVFPAGAPAQPARDNMIESEVLRGAAILAGETIAQKQIEAGEGREFGRLHELSQRDHRGQLHRPAWRMHLAFVAGDDVHPFQKHRLDRGLPRPQAERIIRQRGEIGIEHQRGAIGQMAGGRQMPAGIIPGAAELGRALYQLRLEHGSV